MSGCQDFRSSLCQDVRTSVCQDVRVYKCQDVTVSVYQDVHDGVIEITLFFLRTERTPGRLSLVAQGILRFRCAAHVSLQRVLPEIGWNRMKGFQDYRMS